MQENIFDLIAGRKFLIAMRAILQLTPQRCVRHKTSSGFLYIPDY